MYNHSPSHLIHTSIHLQTPHPQLPSIARLTHSPLFTHSITPPPSLAQTLTLLHPHTHSPTLIDTFTHVPLCTHSHSLPHLHSHIHPPSSTQIYSLSLICIVSFISLIHTDFLTLPCRHRFSLPPSSIQTLTFPHPYIPSLSMIDIFTQTSLPTQTHSLSLMCTYSLICHPYSPPSSAQNSLALLYPYTHSPTLTHTFTNVPSYIQINSAQPHSPSLICTDSLIPNHPHRLCHSPSSTLTPSIIHIFTHPLNCTDSLTLFLTPHSPSPIQNPSFFFTHSLSLIRRETGLGMLILSPIML